jgi:prephenate dehydrogenase
MLCSMQRRKIRHITIIGVGLLGGSVALAAKRKFGAHIAGVGRRQESLDEARKRGIIDSAWLNAAEPACQSDLVILATPVGAFEKHLRTIAPVLKPGATVTDVGSTKAVVVAMAQRIFRQNCPFIGSHPMAGSEQRGPQFASADLLTGATCIVTPTPRTAAGHTTAIERFWTDLGMNIRRMTPAAHDRAVAAISHLPHALSALLMLLPRDTELMISANGFRDMTRLSGGDVEMWRDIFLTNRRSILRAIDKYAKSLGQLRQLLDWEQFEQIEKLLTRARDRRRKFAAARNDQ